MQRTVFYVWYCTAEENQNGTHHKSIPFMSLGKAKAEAKTRWLHNDYVTIDRVREVYEFNEWNQREVERVDM